MKARLAGPARAGTLAAALLLAASALLGLAGTPAPVRGMGPLPACRYDDILTSPRSYERLVGHARRHDPARHERLRPARPRRRRRRRTSAARAGSARSSSTTCARWPRRRRRRTRRSRSRAPTAATRRSRRSSPAGSPSTAASARCSCPPGPGHSEHQLGVGDRLPAPPAAATHSRATGSSRPRASG